MHSEQPGISMRARPIQILVAVRLAGGSDLAGATRRQAVLLQRLSGAERCLLIQVEKTWVLLDGRVL